MPRLWCAGDKAVTLPDGSVLRPGASVEAGEALARALRPQIEAGRLTHARPAPETEAPTAPALSAGDAYARLCGMSEESVHVLLRLHAVPEMPGRLRRMRALAAVLAQNGWRG